MRYPVGDTFAIELAEQLYEGVLGKRQPLPRALQLALPNLTRHDAPPLSVATPALFGRCAVDLTVHAPPAAAPASAAVGLAYFEERPGPHFVGRVGVLSKASAALAPASRYAGVLFHGMAGGGKTACAVELAFHYEHLDRFTHFVWYRAPLEGHESAGSLAAFAQAWEIQLEGLNPPPLLAAVSAEAARFEAFLPRVTEFLRRHSILLALDNLESLLRSKGEWRDVRWAKLVSAMLAHDGDSRVLLTSRVRPVPSNPGLLELPIYALSLDEAALLARQLPNLGRLIRDESRRPLALRTLEVVQGHPKLIEFAEYQAADPQALERHLERAVAASTVVRGRLAAFFGTGESSLEAPEFLAALSTWTRSIVDSLASAPRTFFHFLCCLEASDWERRIVARVWPEFWKHLGLQGDASEVECCVEPLRAVGLVEGKDVYRIHPGVAEAGRERAGQGCQATADEGMAAFWVAEFRAALKHEMRGAVPHAAARLG